jgi:hypothetical protein
MKHFFYLIVFKLSSLKAEATQEFQTENYDYNNLNFNLNFFLYKVLSIGSDIECVGVSP